MVMNDLVVDGFGSFWVVMIWFWVVLDRFGWLWLVLGGPPFSKHS